MQTMEHRKFVDQGLDRHKNRFSEIERIPSTTRLKASTPWLIPWLALSFGLLLLCLSFLWLRRFRAIVFEVSIFSAIVARFPFKFPLTFVVIVANQTRSALSSGFLILWLASSYFQSATPTAEFSLPRWCPPLLLAQSQVLLKRFTTQAKRFELEFPYSAAY